MLLSPNMHYPTQDIPRRSLPSITIRSQRAADLLGRLTKNGRSQVEVIEEALERLSDQRITLAQALTPNVPLDFDWEPPKASLIAQIPDFSD
jgi:hypothetical protein